MLAQEIIGLSIMQHIEKSNLTTIDYLWKKKRQLPSAKHANNCPKIPRPNNSI
jgi:hypothetical protein